MKRLTNSFYELLNQTLRAGNWSAKNVHPLVRPTNLSVAPVRASLEESGSSPSQVGNNDAIITTIDPPSRLNTRARV